MRNEHSETSGNGSDGSGNGSDGSRNLRTSYKRELSTRTRNSNNGSLSKKDRKSDYEEEDDGHINYDPRSRRSRNESLQAEDDGNIVYASRSQNESFQFPPMADEGNIIYPVQQNETPQFALKTHDMVSSCDNDVVNWTEDGEKFVIKNIEAFETRVIPQYFNHRNYSSFVRQMNFYRFTKLVNRPIRRDSNEHNANHVTFYNKNFKRNRRDLLCHIVRNNKKTVAGVGKKDGRLEELEGTIERLTERVGSLEKQLQKSNLFIMQKLSFLQQLINVNPGREQNMPSSLTEAYTDSTSLRDIEDALKLFSMRENDVLPDPLPLHALGDNNKSMKRSNSHESFLASWRSDTILDQKIL